METPSLLIFLLDWLTANTAEVVYLIEALVPVLALFLVGYALYVVERNNTRDKK